MFCVDGFGAVVFGLLWVFGCGGLRCLGCCGFLCAVARGWSPVFWVARNGFGVDFWVFTMGGLKIFGSFPVGTCLI